MLQFILQIHRVTHRIGLHIERLRAARVTQGEAHILAYLAEVDEATVGDVHRAFAHKRSTLTSTLDRLEARGLLVRASDVRDRRTFVVRLTRRGRSVAGAVTRHLRAFERAVLAQTSARDVQAFLRVIDALDRFHAEP
ncbi:MAG TPA: MarR family transcriptional regulator [Vicinamibacterales bacterium]|nr:MarR family transcriptional regulator [Vicinamibacterales bacterium]